MAALWGHIQHSTTYDILVWKTIVQAALSVLPLYIERLAAHTSTMIVKPAYTTRTIKLLNYSSKLYYPAYNDPSNLLERVWQAQLHRQMTPVIYQNSSNRQTDEYGGYVSFYTHVIPPLYMYLGHVSRLIWVTPHQPSHWIWHHQVTLHPLKLLPTIISPPNSSARSFFCK